MKDKEDEDEDEEDIKGHKKCDEESGNKQDENDEEDA